MTTQGSIFNRAVGCIQLPTTGSNPDFVVANASRLWHGVSDRAWLRIHCLSGDAGYRLQL
jgi:hypothetical protein